MVYDKCKACQSRVESCLLPDSHRAQNKHVWCCDFLLGGKHGTRIRKQFKPGVTKKEVEKYEHITIADFERGTFIPQDKSKTPVATILDRYDVEHIQENSQHPNGSVKYYLKELRKLFGHLGIGNLTLEVIEAGRKRFKADKNKGNANVNKCFAQLKAALNHAVKRKYILENPAQHLEPLKVSESKPRFLSVEEIARLRAQIKDRRLSDYVIALLHTGIRPINLINLNWGQVNLEQRIIHITTYKGRKPHSYIVPIDNEFYAVLTRRYEETKGKGRVLDCSNIRKLADEAIQASKINEGREPEELFTIYGLKHCYASHLLMSGASIFDVAKLLGHTDTKMIIKHYGFLTQEHLRSVQSKINLTPETPQRFEVI